MYLASIKLLLPLLTSSDFHFHRDEFLYLAMADHLSWGYLEIPPSLAVFAKITLTLFGDSLYAVRFFPALTGALTLILTGLIAKEFGGRRYAMILAAVAYLTSIVYLRINLFFQPVTFDLFYFVLAVYLLLRILNHGNKKLWLVLGFVVGLGLLNKYTMLLFGFGAAVGLLLSPYRTYYKSGWLWLSALIAFVMLLPNLFWQNANGWPFFEHMRVLAESQLSNVGLPIFLLLQLLMYLYALPVWISGLYFLLISSDGALYRPIGWMYMSILLVLGVLSGKAYYLAATYPMLMAAGAVFIERYAVRTARKWIMPALLVFVVTGGATMVPIGLPVISVEKMKTYFEFGSKYMGIKEVLRWETGEFHELPQDFADMIGWEEQVAAVAEVYYSLSEEERKVCAIFASNYGEAGAIDYYGARYGLPKSISKGSSYWLWGYRDYSGEVMISVGLEKEDLVDNFSEVEIAAVIEHPNARENDISVLIARNLLGTPEEFWEILKRYRY